MYKIVNGNAPQYLKELIPVRDQPVGALNLRSQANEEIRIPFARTESFNRSFLLFSIRLWNDLDREIRNISSLESFKQTLKEPKDRMINILYYGKRWPNIYHARIRIGCSNLHEHLCNNLHVIPSPECDCGHSVEDPMHYFFMCPLFNAQRISLMNTIIALSVDNSLDTLLYGDPNAANDQNYQVFEAVHQFLVDTKRFE
jgi:hypothetical protein